MIYILETKDSKERKSLDGNIYDSQKRYKYEDYTTSTIVYRISTNNNTLAWLQNIETNFPYMTGKFLWEMFEDSIVFEDPDEAENKAKELKSFIPHAKEYKFIHRPEYDFTILC